MRSLGHKALPFIALSGWVRYSSWYVRRLACAMKIRSAEFAGGITGTNPLLERPLPHVAFVGRSNAGKSSVINSLVGRRTLARASGNPGKTQEINLFLINDRAYFTDLPGYGYARVPEKKREKLRKLILWYLTASAAMIREVILILDIRAGLTKLDREMLTLLKECGHPVTIIANKADTLTATKRHEHIRDIVRAAGGLPVILYSATKGVGREELLRNISAVIAVR